MENISKKKEKLERLYQEEDKVNLQISIIDKKLKGLIHEKVRLQKAKEKLAKQVSHNMRLRNTIISELT